MWAETPAPVNSFVRCFRFIGLLHIHLHHCPGVGGGSFGSKSKKNSILSLEAFTRSSSSSSMFSYDSSSSAGGLTFCPHCTRFDDGVWLDCAAGSGLLLRVGVSFLLFRSVGPDGSLLLFIGSMLSLATTMPCGLVSSGFRPAVPLLLFRSVGPDSSLLLFIRSLLLLATPMSCGLVSSGFRPAVSLSSSDEVKSWSEFSISASSGSTVSSSLDEGSL